MAKLWRVVLRSTYEEEHDVEAMSARDALRRVHEAEERGICRPTSREKVGEVVMGVDEVEVGVDEEVVAAAWDNARPHPGPENPKRPW